MTIYEKICKETQTIPFERSFYATQMSLSLMNVFRIYERQRKDHSYNLKYRLMYIH
jgi:hypothetical protein